MSDVYLVLVRALQINIYLGGSIIQYNGHSVAREHLLLLARVYTFYRVLMFKDWLIVESFPSIRCIGSVTFGNKIPRENIFTSNLCLITREC